METSVRLGRVAGIGIGINWSVAVVAWLICWGLASEVLPEAAPGYDTGIYWAAGATAAVVFLASLVAHEMGHSLVAMRVGVQVREITLWMLGGVAKLDGEAPDPAAELRIAVAGPAVSLALGVGFGVLAGALAGVGASPLVVAVLVWLATINVILAVFNLLPAFPTDGGRVLRAALWRRSGSLAEATRRAAVVGRGFGWGFVFLGILAVTGGGGIGGLWFAFIGLFLVAASSMEAAGSAQRSAFAGVRVADVMTPQPITAPADVSVEDLLERWVLTHHVSAYPLVDPTGRPVALATLDDIRRVPHPDRARTPVAEAATALDSVVVTSPEVPVTEVLADVASSPQRRALVVDGGRLVGIVSLTDIARAIDLAGLAGHPVRRRPTEPETTPAPGAAPASRSATTSGDR